MNSDAYVKGMTPHDSRHKLQRAFIYADIIYTLLMYRAGVGSIRELTFITVLRQNFIYELGRPMPTKRKSESPKAKALLEEGTLNPNPEEVRDPKFQQNEFFDPRDIVQVRYEMLRQVSIENTSVTDATEEYGVSRPTYYQARANFDKRGVAGLVPQKRGPRGPHKLQGEVLTFVAQQLVSGEPVRARELVKLVQQKFGLRLHPRTIERAIAGKKTPQ
jgi:transposase